MREFDIRRRPSVLLAILVCVSTSSISCAPNHSALTDDSEHSYPHNELGWDTFLGVVCPRSWEASFASGVCDTCHLYFQAIRHDDSKSLMELDSTVISYPPGSRNSEASTSRSKFEKTGNGRKNRLLLRNPGLVEINPRESRTTHMCRGSCEIPLCQGDSALCVLYVRIHGRGKGRPDTSLVLIEVLRLPLPIDDSLDLYIE